MILPAVANAIAIAIIVAVVCHADIHPYQQRHPLSTTYSLSLPVSMFLTTIATAIGMVVVIAIT